ncbi:ubiquitin-specific protease 25 [Tasmannia lanceolata]|uniref:ubiquitin-specific protease 25 n=1 Tax=Tasmannia lanceolata TaxID=3420 RepID=UPI004064A24C
MALQMSWQPNLTRRKSAPLGLKNLGNTCYLNSVLQCLTYTPPLANFCLKNQHSSLCDSSTDRKRDCPFCILERRIVRSLSIEIPLDAPSKIQSSLRIFAEHFRYGRQEDAHEFLRYVIDACHNTCVKLLKERNAKHRNNGGGKETYYHDTVVKEIFGGALQNQVKCLSCEAESNKTDEIMDISLDLFQSSSLKEALRRFFQPEVLDGNNKYKCENCKKLSAARKQMSVLRAPNVLVIQLKRFEGIDGGKIDRAIAFEEVLMLSNYMSKGSQDPHPEYNLFGSIVHSGYSPESGHYYAYIKDATGRWYCCNDSHVSLSTLHEVLSEKVYILFFSRTNQKPKPTKTSFACNGLKSPGSYDNGLSVNQKATSALKPPTSTPNGVHHPEKDIPTISTNGKVPSNSRIKFGNLKKTEDQRVDANGNANVKVYNNGSMTKHSDVKESSGMEKARTSLLSNCSEEPRVTGKIEMSSHSNGAVGNKSGEVGDHESNRTILSPDGNGEIQRVDADPVKGKVCKDNGFGNVVAVGRDSDSDCAAHAKNDKYHLDVRGFKRKSPDTENCETGTKLEKFKDMLAKDASSDLLSCGWVDKVQDFMHARKRLCAKATGEATDTIELKKLLIADARKTFIRQIPESLKEHLIACLRSFSGENQLLDS